MHRSRERFAAAMAPTVMARLVRAIYSSTCAATGGPHTPGHDDAGTFPATGHVSDFAVVPEICACGRDTPGHDAETPVADGQCQRDLVLHPAHPAVSAAAVSPASGG